MIEQHIDNVIAETFNAIKEVFKANYEKSLNLNSSFSRLIFPKKRDESVRVSEQELRIIFIEQLTEYIKNNSADCNWFFSIETPTLDTYSGFGSEPKLDNKGRSANIDLTIHDSAGNRICLIEFKANNPDKLDYEKDFLKLNNEQATLKYFVQIVESCNRATIDSLESKTSKSGVAKYRCLCLKDGKEIKW